jgi:cyclase
MLTKRIIPCLDIRDGQTVKGINFVNIRNAGDPVELGRAYAEQGADELVFLDITATIEERKTFAKLVRKIALNVNIPFTVGGGVKTEEDVSIILDAGADKITINTSAVQNPPIINKLANQFGSQCIVLAIDANFNGKEWMVYTHGGRTETSIEVMSWAKQTVDRGAGEILLTSMNHDGTKNGFAVELTSSISGSLNMPVIASGGAGNMDHFIDVFTLGRADAALAASIFHFGEINIPDLKNHLNKNNITVRL